uniref:UDP-glucuronate decarboxylase N-terminal domain-containing protein n=1 Tax=Callithrix jacchus TaxID=9483 RepID=A0A8I3WIC3_CALJA
MRSIQENGELKIESKIEEIVEPLREKIRDLEKSFTQKYPPVKFLSEKDRKRILVSLYTLLVFVMLRNFLFSLRENSHIIKFTLLKDTIQ